MTFDVVIKVVLSIAVGAFLIYAVGRLLGLGFAKSLRDIFIERKGGKKDGGEYRR